MSSSPVGQTAAQTPARTVSVTGHCAAACAIVQTSAPPFGLTVR